MRLYIPYSNLEVITNPPPATTYTLSLHDALPIYTNQEDAFVAEEISQPSREQQEAAEGQHVGVDHPGQRGLGETQRSEEHTSELQSQSNLVCRLLLEKTTITEVLPPPRACRRDAP